MLCAILYLKNSDKAIFSYLKKRVKNDCVLKKTEYSKTITVVQSLLLNYHPNYSRQSQSQGAKNQLMFAQYGKTGYDEVEAK